MMDVSRAEFNYFLQQYGASYPYNAITSTRQGFRSKWLMLAMLDFAPMRRHSELYVIPSSAFSKKTATNLIATRQAIPLTPDMDEVMECMDCWGRNVNHVWYELTLNVLEEYLLRDEGVKRELLFLHVILIRIRGVVNRYDFPVATKEGLINEWMEFYGNLYDYTTKDFYELALRSFQFIRAKITHLNSVATTLIAPTLVTSSP